MRQWYIGVNNYWYTACIGLEDVPWYLLATEAIVMHVCDFISRLGIPIPKKWREDYGDLGGVFHVHACVPITQFVFDRTERIRVSLPFFFLKEMFPEEFEDDDELWEDDKQRKKNEKLAKKLDKRYRSAYNKVVKHENIINKGKE